MGVLEIKQKGQIFLQSSVYAEYYMNLSTNFKNLRERIYLTELLQIPNIYSYNIERLTQQLSYEKKSINQCGRDRLKFIGLVRSMIVPTSNFTSDTTGPASKTSTCTETKEKSRSLRLFQNDSFSVGMSVRG